MKIKMYLSQPFQTLLFLKNNEAKLSFINQTLFLFFLIFSSLEKICITCHWQLMNQTRRFSLQYVDDDDLILLLYYISAMLTFAKHRLNRGVRMTVGCARTCHLVVGVHPPRQLPSPHILVIQRVSTLKNFKLFGSLYLRQTQFYSTQF